MRDLRTEEGVQLCLRWGAGNGRFFPRPLTSTESCSQGRGPQGWTCVREPTWPYLGLGPNIFCSLRSAVVPTGPGPAPAVSLFPTLSCLGAK